MKAGRKDVINVTNGLSKSILDKCIGKRVEEQFSDSTLPDSEVEEEKPIGDTDDSSVSLFSGLMIRMVRWPIRLDRQTLAWRSMTLVSFARSPGVSVATEVYQ